MGTLTYFQLRHARLTWLTSVLVLLLQRTPVLRMLVSVDPAATLRSGYVLRALIPATVAIGAVNTVTGATRFTSNPSSPASAKVGQSFTMVFAVTGAPSSPKSYAIDGALPAGLSVPGASVNGTQRTLNASSGQISGTPTESGSFTVDIRAYEGSNRGKKASKAFSYTINVTGGVTNTAPAFTTQPASQTVDVGANVTFTVAASGTPSPTFQWRKDGTDLPGKTSTTLSLSSVTTADAGNYSCVATNAAGSATSSVASLTVNVPPPPPPADVAPSFTTHPTSQTVTEGANVTFTADASGTPAPTFQWRRDSTNLPGKTGKTLSLSNVTTSDAGSYTCVATNSAGSATSNAATLTVNAAPPPPPSDVAPSFTTHPVSQTVTEGANVTFTADASGTPAPTFQWRRDGANLPGKTGKTLSLSNVTTGDAGSYTCVATNSAGSATSNAATLTVNIATPTPPPSTASAPSFTTQPTSLTVDEGSNATFSVAVSGSPSPSLQWQKDGANLAGQTGTTLTLTNVTSADAGAYSCVASNTEGSATSHLAVLTVNTPAPTTPPALATFAIVGQPISLTVLMGNDAIFTVRATGTGLNYQWFKDGQPISGATSESYHVANAQNADAGTYSVEVSDDSGASMTSDPATLNIVTSGFSRIVNLSTRAGIRKSTDAIIPGFVVEGDIALTVLIRAVGPGLATFGVPDVIEDPVMTLNQGTTAIASNDDWGDFPDQDAMRAATDVAGAFQLDLGSRDSALLVTLAPGAYTVYVAGKDGDTGEALVELNTVGSSGTPKVQAGTPGYKDDDDHEEDDEHEDKEKDEHEDEHEEHDDDGI